MYYKIEQLMRKLKRSQPFVQMCLDRFGIKKIRLKTTNQLVYDIPKEKMDKIVEFNYERQRKYPAGTRKKY